MSATTCRPSRMLLCTQKGIREDGPETSPASDNLLLGLDSWTHRSCWPVGIFERVLRDRPTLILFRGSHEVLHIEVRHKLPLAAFGAAILSYVSSTCDSGAHSWLVSDNSVPNLRGQVQTVTVAWPVSLRCEHDPYPNAMNIDATLAVVEQIIPVSATPRVVSARAFLHGKWILGSPKSRTPRLG